MSDIEKNERTSPVSKEGVSAPAKAPSGSSRPRYRGRSRRGARVRCPERVSYKDVDVLRQFINEEGKIRPRRQTKVSAKCQRKLARAIKRARHLALLPFTGQQAQEY